MESSAAASAAAAAAQYRCRAHDAMRTSCDDHQRSVVKSERISSDLTEFYREYSTQKLIFYELMAAKVY